ncbi:hypothetical protein ACO2Q3_25415 [Caulobacter sp. KR2-114]
MLLPTMVQTLYMGLVIAGFVTFAGVLGVVSLRDQLSPPPTKKD